MLEYMSGIHSPGPFLHVSVILVTLALCVLFPTERVGHTSLPQYHRGPGAATVHLLRQVDEMEVQFCVIYNVFCFLFFLTHVTGTILLMIRLFLTSKCKQVGSNIVRVRSPWLS